MRIHHIDADPDPAFRFDADPDPDPTFPSDADPDPDPNYQFYADTDPDPILPLTFPALAPPMLQNDPLRLPPFHFDANPYPDPAFTLRLIRIKLPEMMRIHADPDPKHCFYVNLKASSRHGKTIRHASIGEQV
jgi:hypothetical protein